METIRAAQITCTVYHPVTPKLVETLREMGVREYRSQTSRAVVLRRKKGVLGIGAGIGLEEEPADRIIVFVPEGQGETAARNLAAACDLNVPGRGSVLWENVEMVAGSSWAETPQITAAPGADEVPVQRGLASVTCTVQHGRGNNIVQSVLGLGAPMPVVTAGTGTGLRDRLGIIRIALPAEKDVVHAIVSAHEVKEILASLADAARVGQLGAGFVYASLVDSGVINNMVIRGQRHSASIEQLIAAVDDLKGSADWRKRALGGDEAEDERDFLRDLVNLMFICNEGRASDLVNAAATAGAGGATINRVHHTSLDGETTSVSPAREMSELIVDQEKVDGIVAALKEEGLFDDETAGVLAVKPVALATTGRSARR